MIICMIFLRPFITVVCVFFFNDTATTEIYTLSLHDALPIWKASAVCVRARSGRGTDLVRVSDVGTAAPGVMLVNALGADAYEVDLVLVMEPGKDEIRSEEHTSELQSLTNLVCRLLLGTKKQRSEMQSRTNLECRLVIRKTKKSQRAA